MTATIPNKIKITRAEIKDALLRSGYLIEARIEAYLKSRWTALVDTNASYQDPDTGKPREIDLFAMGGRKAGPDEFDFLFAVLVVECINNPHPMVLLTKEAQAPFLHHHDIKISGLPVKIKSRPKEWESLADYLGMQKYHHYGTPRVATQFCSFVQKRTGNVSQWMAIHDEAQFDCIRKLCDAVDFYINQHFKSWNFGEKEYVNLQIYYPLLVLEGELLDGRVTKRGITLRNAKHLQFRRSIAARGFETDYQIDMIQESFLPQYLDIIDQETSKMSQLLRRRHQAVRASVGAITKAALRLRSPDKIRKVMEF